MKEKGRLRRRLGFAVEIGDRGSRTGHREKLRGVGAHHLFFSQKSRCIATTTPYCLPSSMVTFDKGGDAIRCGLRSEEGDSSRREANTAWRGAVVADRGG
jgi:hypothetical protein